MKPKFDCQRSVQKNGSYDILQFEIIGINTYIGIAISERRLMTRSAKKKFCLDIFLRIRSFSPGLDTFLKLQQHGCPLVAAY